MLPGGMDCWPVVLFLMSFHQIHMTTVSPTDGGCFKNVSMSFTRQITYTEAVRETIHSGWWWGRKTRIKYRIKKLTRTVTDTNDVRLPCNTSTIGNSKEIQTQPSTTAVNESSISNGTADLQGQQDGQPSSGQMAGFIIGVIAIVTVVVVIVVVAVKFIRRRRQRKQSPFSGKSNKQTPSPSENSAGADVYYESPEVIRERKRRQREANQDAANLSYNKNESDGHVTGLDQTVYSYNHLREADNLQSGGELATNTHGHLQDFHETQTENETSHYYNLEATATSADVRAGQNTKYDNLSHLKVTGQSGSNGVTRADYDHVYIDHDTAV